MRTPLRNTHSLWLWIGLVLLWSFSCEPTTPREQTPPEVTQDAGTEQVGKDAPTENNTKENETPDTNAPDTKPPDDGNNDTKPLDNNAPDNTKDSRTPDVSEPKAPDAGKPERAVERTVETGQGKSPQTIAVQSANDVVTSYLLSGSSWNYFHGSTVKLGRHNNTGNTSYFTALRFKDVQIPQGATITKAFVSWMPHNEVDSNHRLLINIYAEQADDAAPYNPKDYNKGRPDQRLRTKAKIDRWVVRCRDDCSSDATSPKYEFDCPQRKKDCWDRKVRYQCPKDLKAVLQEVIARPGWKAGNAISVFLFNAASDRDGAKYKDNRTIIGYDAAKPQAAPQLTIHFTP